MTVFTAQALLGLALFKCLLVAWRKLNFQRTTPGTPHRQCSGALTLLILKVAMGCRFLSGEKASSSTATTRENSHVLVLMYG